MVGSWRRTKASATSRTQQVEYVRLSPLPCWQHLPATTWRPWVRGLVYDIDREAAAERATSGKTSLGAAKILAVDPRQRREPPQSSPQPRFHASDPNVLRSMIEIWQAVLTAYYRASLQLRQGNRNTKFPAGTFPPALPFVPFPRVPRTRGQPS